jgi:cytochrome c peroxidase
MNARVAARLVSRALLRLAVLCAPACGASANGAAPDEAPLLDDVLPTGFGAIALADTAPAENTLTEARARLGRRLFFDARLSSTGQVSCASCHQQTNAFSDPAPVSKGVGGLVGTRNAPALVDLAWGTSFFWDGRAASLEEQAGKPIENPIEMNLPLADAVARVTADEGYARAFTDAYGGAPTEATLRFALASFVRVLVSGDSPYDRHLRGDDTAFGAAAARGETIFGSERGACFHCHPAGALTNGGSFNNGTFVSGGDTGRQMITGRTGDLGKFKVPGLRNVAASAPYMHDGSLATLEDVIEQYDRGGRGDPSTDPQIRPLGLSMAEKSDLLAFLRSLTDDRFLTDARYGAP